MPPASPSSVFLVPTKNLSREHAGTRCISASDHLDAIDCSSLNDMRVFRPGVRELSGLGLGDVHGNAVASRDVPGLDEEEGPAAPILRRETLA
jgi:hypothetical protein